MFTRRAPHSQSLRKDQRGIALLVVLTLVGLLVTMFAVVFVNDLVQQNRKQQQTADALARAKEALIGYATGVDLDMDNPCASPAAQNNCVRPGDMPCPATDETGVAAGTCGNASGSTGQVARLGRLPWRTLGLDDLRDGDGEPLWYAVSNNFKYNTRTVCNSPEDDGCLNSHSKGTITVRNDDGSIVQDGSNPDPFTPSGSIAVIISPGTVLQRTDSAVVQDRSAASVNDPTNYLDIGNGEGNDTFTDGSANGFINGPIYDANNRLIVNDRVLPITYADLMPTLQRRVAQETMNCLTAYAASSNGRYPWPARIDQSATLGDYSSQQGYRFGRVPNSFTDTLLGLIPAVGPLAGVVNLVCGLLPGLCMSTNWPDETATPACNIPVAGDVWWMNWKEQVFYGVAVANQPDAIVQLLPPAVSVGAPGSCSVAGNCMTINPPSIVADKRVVVIVAGQSLSSVAGGQPRILPGDRSNVANYLEDENASNIANSPSNFTFTQKPAGTSFNDFLLYQ